MFRAVMCSCHLLSVLQLKVCKLEQNPGYATTQKQLGNVVSSQNLVGQLVYAKSWAKAKRLGSQYYTARQHSLNSDPNKTSRPMTSMFFLSCVFSYLAVLDLQHVCFCPISTTSQGAPVPECRCCYCHTCSAHRPSYLPLPSISPGVQVLLSFILSFFPSNPLTYPHTFPSPLLTISSFN